MVWLFEFINSVDEKMKKQGQILSILPLPDAVKFIGA